MLRLKLQSFDHLMQKTDSEKTLMLGKVEGKKRKEQQMELVQWSDLSPAWLLPLSPLLRPLSHEPTLSPGSSRPSP